MTNAFPGSSLVDPLFELINLCRTDRPNSRVGRWHLVVGISRANPGNQLRRFRFTRARSPRIQWLPGVNRVASPLAACSRLARGSESSGWKGAEEYLGQS